MKIKDAIQIGRKRIGDNPSQILAVEVLLAFVIGKDREYLIAHPDEEVEEKCFIQYTDSIFRHERGKPVEHLINLKEFYGLPLYIDERALIPRPETEMLVDKVIEIAGDKEIKILDIGTGSGNISVAIADNLKNAFVTAVDVSEDALEVAKINVEKLNLKDRIKLFKSDLLSDVEDNFDIIVANLPYIGTHTNSFVSKEAKEYEPSVALFGGEDGLRLYKELFEQLKENPICNYLLGEFGFLHREKMIELVNTYFPLAKFEILKDLAGLDRCFIIKF